jgi:acetolactate synthase I/III small subunit
LSRTLAVEVENRPGELARIVNLFAARGVNIESLSVDATTDVAISVMSIVVDADDRATDQLLRTLDKQVRVLSAREVSEEAS